ncbi:MAG: hypothetical protein JST26_16935 [Bacteroidetes bacterium]|nr:hypothetical protein [Bacteroidota bacterium]
MMRFIYSGFLLFLSFYLGAQSHRGKTAVFKVRAPLSKCLITSPDEVFYLEKESDFLIRIKGRNQKVQVKVTNGKVISVKNDVYRIRFQNPGAAAISVYQVVSSGTRIIGTKKMEILPPKLYFCGLPVDSSTKVLKLGSCHIYAYSGYYKQNLPVSRFTMLYFNDVRSRGGAMRADTFRSDVCKLSSEMKQKVLHFQPKTNRIYFYNILCALPDGTFRLLEPVELFAIKDSVLNDYSVIYTLRKKKV